MDKSVIIYDAVLMAETERAVLVEYEDEEVWLPKSQINYDQGAERGDLIEVELPQWLAIRNGWSEL